MSPIDNLASGHAVDTYLIDLLHIETVYTYHTCTVNYYYDLQCAKSNWRNSCRFYHARDMVSSDMKQATINRGFGVIPRWQRQCDISVESQSLVVVFGVRSQR